MAELLGSTLRARLSPLRLVSPRQGPQTNLAGAHKGRRRGRSMEFAEHRDYSPGDDLRHLDWAAFARSERLVVKEFESELERTVLVVVDLSASMSESKRRLAQICAAAFSWVGLLGQDRLGLATLGAEPRYHPPVRGRGQWGRLMDWLGAAAPGGRANLPDGLRNLVQRLPRSSLVLLLSDCLEEQAAGALAFAHHRKHQVALLQILDQFDREPPWLGPLRLEDIETAEFRQLSLEDQALGFYHEALEQHCQALRDQCRHLGFHYHCCPAESAPEEVLLRQLVERGWLA
ncbi:MAG: DUF58 domain-containing protein [Vulcanimicrobiota bacterium]